MLKLTKRKNSPNWFARGTFLGVYVEQSTGTSNRAQAEILKGKLERDIFEQQIRGPVRVAEGFASAALKYMDSGGERRFLAPLLRHFGDVPIDQIDQQAIDQAATKLYPKCTPATRARCVHGRISAILRFAGITLNIRRPKTPPGVVRWLTHEEANRLIDACAPHLRPLVMFLLYTGARLGEALWLDWRCIDLARGHVSFPKTKNGHPRGVPLHRDLVTELANLPHRDGSVFRRPDGKPYNPRGERGGQIKTAFQGAVKRAGLNNFRVHDCRLGNVAFCNSSRLDSAANARRLALAQNGCAICSCEFGQLSRGHQRDAFTRGKIREVLQEGLRSVMKTNGLLAQLATLDGRRSPLCRGPRADRKVSFPVDCSFRHSGRKFNSQK
jgi:integrase